MADMILRRVWRNLTSVAVWHSELIRANVCDKELAIELTINIFGIMTAYWVDYGLSYVDSQVQFRFPLALSILLTLITLASILVLPESPLWLITYDRHDEAKHILWVVERMRRYSIPTIAGLNAS